MGIFFIIILCCLAAFLEATIVPIPFVVVGFTLLAIFQRKNWIFILAIGVGLFLDSISFRTLGATSLFLLMQSGIIFLYGRKFQTVHMLFAILFATFAGLMYVVIFNTQQFFILVPLTVVTSVFLSIAVFLLRAKISPKAIS